MHLIMEYLHQILIVTACQSWCVESQFAALPAFVFVFIYFRFFICDGHSKMVVAESVDKHISIHVPNVPANGLRDSQPKHRLNTNDGCFLSNSSIFAPLPFVCTFFSLSIFLWLIRFLLDCLDFLSLMLLTKEFRFSKHHCERERMNVFHLNRIFASIQTNNKIANVWRKEIALFETNEAQRLLHFKIPIS